MNLSSIPSCKLGISELELIEEIKTSQFFYIFLIFCSLQCLILRLHVRQASSYELIYVLFKSYIDIMEY